ncbi:MAG: FecR family protein [Nitrospirota bacterium]
MMKQIVLSLCMVGLLSGYPLVSIAEQGPKNAVVSMVTGTVRTVSAANPEGRILKIGDKLARHDSVTVEKGARLAIRFPDRTVMRFAEASSFRIQELSYDKGTKDKHFKISLFMGKLWAQVKKLTTPKSAVAVETSNAVAGVRGTVYGVTIEPDASSLFRVYEGSVSVSGTPKPEATQPQAGLSRPKQVPGPHAVPPPYHEVAMQEWTVIVMAMQQVTVTPDGTASKPQKFDPSSETDEWLLWNQKQDALMKL